MQLLPSFTHTTVNDTFAALQSAYGGGGGGVGGVPGISSNKAHVGRKHVARSSRVTRECVFKSFSEALSLFMGGFCGQRENCKPLASSLHTEH